MHRNGTGRANWACDVTAPTIHRGDPPREYYFEERCWITEWLNAADCPEHSIARARVAPGATTRWHTLTRSVETYVILHGEGCAEVGDLKVNVSAGDRVRIPAGTRQRITNTAGLDLVFLAICTPRFTPDQYTDLESPAPAP